MRGPCPGAPTPPPSCERNLALHRPTRQSGALRFVRPEGATFLVSKNSVDGENKRIFVKKQHMKKLTRGFPTPLSISTFNVSLSQVNISKYYLPFRKVFRWVVLKQRQSHSSPAKVCAYTTFWQGSHCLHQVKSLDEGNGNLDETSCKEKLDLVNFETVIVFLIPCY